MKYNVGDTVRVVRGTPKCNFEITRISNEDGNDAGINLGLEVFGQRPGQPVYHGVAPDGDAIAVPEDALGEATDE